MDSVRAVLIRFTRGAKQHHGSGLHVGRGLILTADHAANGEDFRVYVNGKEHSAQVHLRTGRADVDLAILVAPTLPDVEPLQFALVNRKVAGQLDECQALGFPNWKTSDRLAQAHGYIPTAEGRELDGSPGYLSFKVTDPEAKGLPVPADSVECEGSPWAGISGAVVITAGDLIVGVVRSHVLSEGNRSLTVTPINAIDCLSPGLRENMWQSLGVFDPTKLPYLPRPIMASRSEAVDWLPPLRGDEVERSQEIDALLSMLLAAPGSSATGPIVGLVGAGGFGKSTLARMVAQHQQLRVGLSDGVIWVTVGQDASGPELADRVANVIGFLTGTKPGVTDPLLAGIELGRVLMGRRLLLVVDDVWSSAQVEPFLIGGRRTARLFTTRTRGILPESASIVPVNQMSDIEAITLLTNGISAISPGLRHELLQVTGRWPILLSLVRSAVREAVTAGGNVQEEVMVILDALQTGGPAALDPDDAQGRDRAVERTVRIGLDRLNSQQLERYLELSVFDLTRIVPGDVVGRYWKHTAGFTLFQTQKTCATLADLSLIAGYRRNPDILVMHDVVLKYLQHVTGGRNIELHRAVIDANRDLVPLTQGRSDWAALPATHEYLWAWLPHHLLAADLGDDLNYCLQDARWLVRKLELSGPAALEADLLLSDSPVAKKLAKVVRQNAGALGPLTPAGSLAATFASRIASDDGVLSSVRHGLLRQIEVTHVRPIVDPPDLPHPLLRRVLTGSGGVLPSMVVAPDGSWLAASSWQGGTRMWDSFTGDSSSPLVEQFGQGRISAVAPDGSWLAIEEAGIVHIRAADTGMLRVLLEDDRHSPKDGFWASAVAPDGSWLALASSAIDGAIRIWDSATGALIQRLSVDAAYTYSLLSAPDGSWLAAAGGDGELRLWDVETGKLRYSLPANMGPALSIPCTQSLEVAPDGSWLATAGGDGAVRIWDPTTGELRFTFAMHSGRVHALEVAPDGSWLASAGSGGSVCIWSMETRDLLHTLEGQYPGRIYFLLAASDGSWLASASGSAEYIDNNVRLWSPDSGALIEVLNGHSGDVFSLVAAPDNSWLASASGDGTIRIWDLSIHERSGTLDPNARSVFELLAPRNGSWIASKDPQGIVRTWNPRNGALYHVFASGQSSDRWMVLAGDGESSLTSASVDGNIRIWNPITGRLGHTLTGHNSQALAIVTAQSNSVLAAEDAGGTVRTWDGGTGILQQCFGGCSRVWGEGDGNVEIDLVSGMAVAPDGSWLAITDNDHKILIVEPRSGVVLQALVGHSDMVVTLSPTRDGSLLASSSLDGTVRIWDLPSGTLRQALACLTYSLLPSPRGDWIATFDRPWSVDGVVTVWDVASGLKRHALPLGHPKLFFGVTDLILYASAGDEGIRIYDLGAGVQRCLLSCEMDDQTALAVSPDQSMIASTGSDGVMRLWDLTTGDCVTSLRTAAALELLEWTEAAIVAAGLGGIYFFRQYDG